MEAVLDAPMTSDQDADVGWLPLRQRQRGDDAYGLHGPYAGPYRPGFAGDLAGLGGMGKVDPAGNAFDGPFDLASVCCLSGQ